MDTNMTNLLYKQKIKGQLSSRMYSSLHILHGSQKARLRKRLGANEALVVSH